MMHAMHQEVQKDSDRMVGEIVVDVEQEPVQGVLQDRPDDVPGEEAQHGLGYGV